MEKVLVAGATGTTGKQIIELLQNDQYFIPVAMVHEEEQRSQFESRDIEARVGDLTNDISAITKGIDKVIFAAGSGGEAVEKVDRDGAIKLIDAAGKVPVKKFVMLSSMGADAPEEASELQDYLKAKQAADEYLRSSDLTYAIVRPGSLTNDVPTGKIQLNASLSEDGSITRGDVAQVLVRCLHDDVAVDETFEILNGDNLIAEALNKVQTA